MDLFNYPGCVIRYFPGVKKEQTKLCQSYLLGFVFQGPEHSLVFKKELQTKQTSFQNGLATGDFSCLHDLNSPLRFIPLHQSGSAFLGTLCSAVKITFSTGFSSICCFSRMNFISISRQNPSLCCWHILCNILEEWGDMNGGIAIFYCHVLVFHLGLVWSCIKIPLQNKGKYWVSAFGLEIRRGTWTTGWWTIMEFSKRFWQIHFA